MFSFLLHTPGPALAPASRKRKKKNNLATKTASFEFEILLNAHPTGIAKRSALLQKEGVVLHFSTFGGEK